MQRADPDRLGQHRRPGHDRRRRGPGGPLPAGQAGGGRATRRPTSSRCRVAATSSAGLPAPTRARRAAGPRPRRRRPGRRRGVDGRPVLRRGPGRLRLGTRRRRHEGHGRDDRRGRPRLQAHRLRPAARPDLRVHVRRGGRRHWGAQWLVDHHPELFAGATEAISEVGGFSVGLCTTTAGPTSSPRPRRASPGPLSPRPAGPATAR